MSAPLHVPALPAQVLPIGPSLQVWRSMTQKQRDDFLIAANEALSDPLNLMGEGRPHKKAKTRALDMLGLHFKTMGRVVYLAEEMTVVYPGEAVFTPDLLAVVGVSEPEDDERLAWVVADEGKGLDVVVEILHRGNRDKDLVANVERYARLGIPEYFVYDRARQQVHGYALSGDGAKRYRRIVPQAGRYSSVVLGLDLAIQGGRLRFFQGSAELFDTAELLTRLAAMMGEMEAKAEAAEVRAEQDRERTEAALSGMREAIVSVLIARGIEGVEDVRARIEGCEDVPLLQIWLVRAATVGSMAEVFEP